MDFIEIISLWPSIPEFARDIGAPYERCAQWHKRNSIKPTHWPFIVKAALRRANGFTDKFGVVHDPDPRFTDVTFETLAIAGAISGRKTTRPNFAARAA